jgi:ABC-type lipoprotein export system ATPase subunit
MTRSVIRIQDLRKAYDERPGGRQVLRGIDLDVKEGAFVSIVGRSGSGKTTLLNIIGGLDTRYRGSAEVGGRTLGDLTDTELSELRNSTVGYVFQAYHLLDHLTAAENVAVPALFARGGRALSAARARQRAKGVLDEVGLADRAADRPGLLSGGERQRLVLARALFCEPAVLLCDEPTGNLDARTGTEIIALLNHVHRARGVTLLVATHDETICRVAETLHQLSDGVLTEAT